MPQTIQIGTETIGRRIYVTGNTYSIKDQLSNAGCTYDGARRQWWIGSGKAEQIQALVARLNGAEAPKEDLSRRPLIGKATYKGRTYYVLGITSDSRKLRLTVLDASIDFWADASLCEFAKRYPVREYRGQKQYTTLASIRAFVKQQSDPATARVQCAECGSWHDAGEDCRDCGGC